MFRTIIAILLSRSHLREASVDHFSLVGFSFKVHWILPILEHLCSGRLSYDARMRMNYIRGDFQPQQFATLQYPSTRRSLILCSVECTISRYQEVPLQNDRAKLKLICLCELAPGAKLWAKMPKRNEQDCTQSTHAAQNGASITNAEIAEERLTEVDCTASQGTPKES